MDINDVELDGILISALYRAAELDYGDISSDDELNMPSARFQRKSRALLRNPMRYIRNLRRPIYLKALRGVAAAVIAFVLLLGVAMTVSPTVRAAVTNFVRSWFEDRTIYTSIGDAFVGEWVFGYIPDGFELEYELTSENLIFRVFGNEYGQYLFITISASAITLDNEHHEYFETMINGHFASAYQELTGEHPNNLVIFFESQGTFIVLSSELAVDELIRIAENIKY